MEGFVIAYSIVMFLLLAVAVAVCCLLLRTKNKKPAKEKSVTTGDAVSHIFADVVGIGGNLAFLLIDAVDRHPVYISPNISKFVQVSAEDLYIDLALAKKTIDKKYNREFERRFAKWNKKNVFEQEFAYGKDSFAKLQAFCAESDGKNYVAFVFDDMTEQKHSRDEMQKQLDSALDQAAAKSSYLSNMSHEIRTPMNGIMGMMSLAKMNINDREKVLNYLERAGDLSVFLLGMINDILDISKIESGKMQLFNTQLDIFAFAEKIKNMFNGTVTSKGIGFVVETVDLTVRYVIGDEMRLTQVVTNLVSNANKFTPSGGKITVTFKQLDLMGGKIQLMIRVRDTGKGIAPENIHKIMRPFEQEEASTSHQYGGTGLGLAICDNIVRLMGGNIVIDSTLGKGTDFSVFLSLPVADVVQDMSTPVVVEEAAPQDVDFEYDGCRILLAEDNEVNAEIAVEILESEGAKVTLAKDGQEAVDIFCDSAEGSFDLLLLDIQMPRLDGRQAAVAIRNSGRGDAQSVPIIALSADAFLEDVIASEKAGMDGHVSKPVDFDDLRKRAGEIILAKREQFSTKKTKKS